MKILITGGSGFLGKHLIKELLRLGHEIVAIESHTTIIITDNKLTTIPYCIKNEFDPENLFIKLGSPDMVLHLAWWGLPNYNSQHHITECLPASILFLSNLIQHGIKKIVTIGTCFEYGMQEGELFEHYPSNPVTCYGIAKDALRKSLELETKASGCELVWLRVFYLYGEGQSEKSLFSQFKQAVLNKESVFRMSKGTQIRDFLAIEDAARYIAQAATITHEYPIINIASGKPISVNELVEKWKLDMQVSIELERGVYPIPNYEPESFWGNNGVIRKLGIC